MRELPKKHIESPDKLPCPSSGGGLTLLYLKLILTAVFWGGTFIAGRVIAREAQPFSAAFLRFLLASLFMLGFVMRAHGNFPFPRPNRFPLLLSLGLSGVLAYNFFFFSGLKTITAGRASLIIAANPAIIAISSRLFLGERLNSLKGAGILLSVAGAVVVISGGDPARVLSGGVGKGELYLFACVASWAAYSILGKVVMRELSPLLAATYACVLGGICLFPPAVHEGILRQVFDYSPAVWLGVLYLGLLGSAVGFLWYYEGIERIGPSRTAIFISLVPVSSILLAALILGEPVDSSLAVGAVLTVSGVYLMNRIPAERKT
jgi:drug/metabolite transporter (DMT)-like permease